MWSHSPPYTKETNCKQINLHLSVTIHSKKNMHTNSPHFSSWKLHYTCFWTHNKKN